MTKETFIPYGKQTITDEDIKAVVETLRSPLITQGPKVEEFEERICETVSSKYAIATNSATSALHIACLALNVSTNNWVWTSPITFVASANCALYCGAKVDFIDIDMKTGLIDIDKLKDKLLEAKKRNKLPKAIIPVHLGGASCDMREIGKLSKEYGFKVIEDASHAIGGAYKEEPVGNCKYSDICIFSFHPVKIITTGEGGVAVTNNEYLGNLMRQLRSHGITKDTKCFKEKPAGMWTYEQQILGFNYRMTEIQASLGISQLKRLKEIIEERQYIHQKYRELINCSEVGFIETPCNTSTAQHLSIITIKDNCKTKHKRVFSYLRSKGIGVQLHYWPVHLQPYYKEMGFKEGQFPQAETYGNSAISIPVYPGLGDQNITRVVKTLIESI